MAKHCVDAGARVTVADVDLDAVARAVKDLGAETVDSDKAHALECDIFAPCALGGVIRDDTIPELKCRVIAGAANNQLDRPELGETLADAGILYAPDFIVNAGGLINVADELMGYDRERAMKQVEDIFRTLREVFRISKKEDVTPARAAELVAEERIRSVSRLRKLYVPGERGHGTLRR